MKQIKVMVRPELEPETPGLRVRRADHSATLPPVERYFEAQRATDWHMDTHRRNDAYHVSQGCALTPPLGYVTFRYKQEHWLLSTHTLPSSHFPSGQWQPSVQGELHLALSLLIFRHVRGHDDPHSLYSNPAGHCKAMRRKWFVWNALWAQSLCVKLHELMLCRHSIFCLCFFP